MRKLPLLIIAVICVDMGFVAFMSANRQAEIASQEFNKPIRTIIPQPNLSSEFAKTNDSSVMSVASVKTEAAGNSRPSLAIEPRVDRQFRSSLGSRGIAKRTLIATRKVPAFPARTNSSIGRDTYAIRKPADVMIWYPGGPKKPVEAKLPEPRPATKELPKRENRSLVARLLVPIFKKPYGWIKAVGSRLN